MNELKYFYIYNSYLEGIEPLSYSERGRLFTALLMFSAKNVEMPLTGAERYVYPLMRDQIIRDREAYSEKARLSSANGKKGAKVMLENRAARKAAEAVKNDKPPESFEVPSLKQVEDFCRDFKLKVEPKRFYNYFQAGGWKDSSGRRVSSWQQKLLTWNQYENSFPPQDIPEQPREINIDMEELKRSIDKI